MPSFASQMNGMYDTLKTYGVKIQLYITGFTFIVSIRTMNMLLEDLNKFFTVVESAKRYDRRIYFCGVLYLYYISIQLSPLLSANPIVIQ